MELPPIDVEAALHEVATPPEETVVIPDTPVQAATEDLGTVASDTAKLLELQIQLFETECKQSALRLIQPLGMLLAGVATAIASLMLLFHALGWALHDIFGLSVSLSLLIVAIVGGVSTAIIFNMMVSELKQPRISFAKSKAELMRNLACFANFLRPK